MARVSTCATTSTSSEKLSLTILSSDQTLAIDRLYEYDETFLIAPTGAGKTVCLLTAVAELLAEGTLSRVLIVAPLKVCQTTWATEPGKWEHFEGLEVAVAVGTPEERSKAIDSGAAVVVINEENVAWLFETYPNHDFNGIAIDEIGKWASPGGARYKKLVHKMKGFRWRAGMTADPCAEDWVGLFAQMKLLDLGKALGRSKDRYLKEHFFPTDWEQRNWEVKPTHEALIAAKIRPLVYIMPDYKHELPEIHVHYEYLDLDPAAMKFYHRMRIHSVVELEDGVTIKAPTAAARSGKLEQIAAGFVYLPTDKRNPKAPREWEVIHEMKAQWLVSRAATIKAANESVIIIYWYEADLVWIRELFPGALELGKGFKAMTKLMNQWRKKTGQVLLLHPASASHGIDGLQETCHRELWVNPIWSHSKSMQTRGRVHRRGQQFEVFVEIAVARGTVDEIKIASVEGKGEYHELFVAHLNAPE